VRLAAVAALVPAALATAAVNSNAAFGPTEA
jgi:hypothetical protein